MTWVVRVGQGYDLHRVEKGRKLMLAGVEIASSGGLAGHSDADVVLHAVMDALLGGAGLGDIGEHFPESDPRYKDVDSGSLLGQVKGKVELGGYTVLNVDTTIIAERPKLGAYKGLMRNRLAELLDLEVSAVSIKAKTNEGLGEIGAGAAIACQAIVTLAAK